MNEIVPKEKSLPSITQASDPWLATATRVGNDRAFLKFKKGEFVKGTDEDEVPIGTEMVANMLETQIGWLKWADGEVVEERMFPWAKGHPYREELGDLDPDEWEVDEDGKPSDPWSETVTVPLKSPVTGEQLTFTSQSVGGRGAVSKLVQSWRYGLSRGESGLPIVRLDVGGYEHKKKSVGWVDTPILKIIRWESEADLIAGKAADDELQDKVPF